MKSKWVTYIVEFYNNAIIKLNKQKQSIKESLISKFDWIVCFIFSIVITLTSLYFLSPENKIIAFSTSTDGTLYLLSAISQALAAIFALVFTVTLMAATMAKKYTAIDKFFNKETKYLMILFIVGIILPFLLLKIEPNNDRIYNTLISISIGLAAFCIAAIIPYLKNSNNILKFDIGVGNLIGELTESTISDNYSKASTIVDELLDIGESAIENKREDSLDRITYGISYSIEIPLLRQGGILPTFDAFSLIFCLNTLGKKATEKQMDRVASSIIYRLQNSGMLLIKKDVFHVSAKSIIYTLNDMGITACKHHLKETSIFSMVSILNLAKISSSNKNRELETKSAYYHFGICAAYMAKYYPESISFVYDEMELNNQNINEILPPETIDKINNRFPEVKGCLEKFIKHYQLIQKRDTTNDN